MLFQMYFEQSDFLPSKLIGTKNPHTTAGNDVVYRIIFKSQNLNLAFFHIGPYKSPEI